MKKTLAIVFALLCAASLNANQFVKNIRVDIYATAADSLPRRKNDPDYTDIRELQQIINNGYTIESITPITVKIGEGSLTQRLIVIYSYNRYE